MLIEAIKFYVYQTQPESIKEQMSKILVIEKSHEVIDILNSWGAGNTYFYCTLKILLSSVSKENMEALDILVKQKVNIKGLEDIQAYKLCSTALQNNHIKFYKFLIKNMPTAQLCEQLKIINNEEEHFKFF